MKKFKHILLLAIVLFCLLMMFISCNRHSCPAYGGRNTNGEYLNVKLKNK